MRGKGKAPELKHRRANRRVNEQRHIGDAGRRDDGIHVLIYRRPVCAPSQRISPLFGSSDANPTDKSSMRSELLGNPLRHPLVYAEKGEIRLFALRSSRIVRRAFDDTILRHHRCDCLLHVG